MAKSITKWTHPYRQYQKNPTTEDSFIISLFICFREEYMHLPQC